MDSELIRLPVRTFAEFKFALRSFQLQRETIGYTQKWIYAFIGENYLRALVSRKRLLWYVDSYKTQCHAGLNVFDPQQGFLIETKDDVIEALDRLGFNYKIGTRFFIAATLQQFEGRFVDHDALEMVAEQMRRRFGPHIDYDSEFVERTGYGVPGDGVWCALYEAFLDLPIRTLRVGYVDVAGREVSHEIRTRKASQAEAAAERKFEALLRQHGGPAREVWPGFFRGGKPK